jgi:hypothetical protein
MPTVFLADLIADGARIEPHEAVAIAQLLIGNGAVAPSPENVQLSSDGAASCAGCDVTPAVFEIAALLQKLIPPGTPRVPGGLRYAIARALLEVEAPPFDSVKDFSQSLERFESGDRAAVVGGLVGRLLNPAAITAVPLRIVSRQSAAAPAPALASADVLAMPTSAPRRLRGAIAAAAALVLGAAGLIGVADVMRSGHVTPRTVAGADRRDAAAPAPVVETPRVDAVATERMAQSVPQPLGSDLDPRDSVTMSPKRKNRDVTRPSRLQDAPSRLEDDEVVPALDREHRPVFSPAFASNGSALFSGSAIAAASADASAGDLALMTIVDDGARNYHVQPSPDGTQIAFDSDRDGERGVYIAKRDGTNVRRISGTGYAAMPTWSPDGRRLAYIRAEDSNAKVWNLWLQSVADGLATRLTNYRYGQGWSASWFPDNRRICYAHGDALLILDIETGPTRRFASPVKGHVVRTPAVSPDGSQVIFQVFRQGAWVLDLRTSTMRPVLADPTAEEFAWSPDGRRVAFHSRRDDQWSILVISGG